MPRNRSRRPPTDQERLLSVLLRDRKDMLATLVTIEKDSKDPASRDAAKATRERVRGIRKAEREEEREEDPGRGKVEV